MRSTFFFLASLALSAATGAAPILRAEDPALSPDGTMLAFSWQGDLWTAPAGGGEARRLTVHPASEIFPRWSPDGSRIYFGSNRSGNYDIWSVGKTGDDLQRVTFGSSDEYVNAISPDGQWVYGYTTAWDGLNLYKVRATGGEQVALTLHPQEVFFSPTISSDGKKIAYCGSGSAGSWRKPGIRGAYAADIFVADNGIPPTNHRNITHDDTNCLYPNFAEDGSIVYVSNRSGTPNVWRMNADGSGQKQLTKHTVNVISKLSLGAHSSKAVYEFGSEIWVLDLKTLDHHPVSLDVPTDQRANAEQTLALTSGVSAYAVSPDSKRAALVVRGDIYLIPESGGTTRRLTTSPGADESPLWLDAKTILFATGRSGRRELMTVNVDGVEKPFFSDAQDATIPVLSPDKKSVAFLLGGRKLAVMPATGGTPKVLAENAFIDGLTGTKQFNWSPDSKWLTFIDTSHDRGSNVIAVNVETGKTVVVAKVPRDAATPNFLPNGQGIYFVGIANEQPEIFVVDLVPNPIRFTEDDLDNIDEPAKAEAGPAKVEIYEPGLESRMRSIASGVGFEAECAPDSRTIYTTVDGQLVTVSVSGGLPVPVAGVTGPGSQISFGAGGKVYFVGAGQLNQYSAARGSARPTPFQARPTINLKAEEMALFEEIWWVMDRFYYNPKMNDRDWPGIKAEFAKIVPYCYDRTDFYALMGEMMERLDSSHLGATPPRTAPLGDENTGILGVLWDWKALGEQNKYVVASVMDGSPAWHPASKLMPGDQVLKVDGVDVSAKPISGLLNQKVGKKVKLDIVRGGKPMTVLIQPISRGAFTSLSYEDWVSWTRQQTEKLSGGKLTYLHIEAMNDASHQRFLREIRTYTQEKSGVLIDVRYNGGGSTSHLALGVLIKTPWLIRTMRGRDGVRVSENVYRGDSLELPSALMTNEFSFSNAEIMSEGFRKLKVGPIIGERTAGGVIGTSAYGLWDGGSIRTPMNGSYAIDGENLENNGRRPDIRVPFDINLWQQGRDNQLEAAVKELLSKLPRGR